MSPILDLMVYRMRRRNGREYGSVSRPAPDRIPYSGGFGADLPPEEGFTTMVLG
jgi:hypothetical protein